jgi:hypothetical protein
MLSTMTEPAPEGIETKDVHSQMMSDGDFETKNLPGGYLPAGVPNTDRTGTQKEAAPAAEESAPAESDGGSGSTSSKAAASKTTASKSTTASK